jgi:hypothetical protein
MVIVSTTRPGTAEVATNAAAVAVVVAVAVAAVVAAAEVATVVVTTAAAIFTTRMTTTVTTTTKVGVAILMGKEGCFGFDRVVGVAVARRVAALLFPLPRH